VNPAATLKSRLDAGEVIVLDGGIGTELEARGVPMEYISWCGHANFDYLDVVQRVHEDYIRAGVDVITTNTFSSAKNVLEAAGYDDRFVEANERAVRAAQEARRLVSDGRAVAIGGSVSAVAARSVEGAKTPSEQQTMTIADDEELRDSYRGQANVLAEAGVDILILEMIGAADYGKIAVEACLETGLPVWLGISPGFRMDGDRAVPDGTTLVDGGVPLYDLVDAIVDQRLAAVTVMHSTLDVIHPSLDIIAERYDGPLGVYPEAGQYTRPHWEFSDMTPEQLLEAARGWVDRGVQIVGGCCGIRPEHIRALRDGLPKRAGDRAFTRA
jgi:S-methylmethionine-dependent homocysteine/selenocysteine methylase